MRTKFWWENACETSNLWRTRRWLDNTAIWIYGNCYENGVDCVVIGYCIFGPFLLPVVNFELCCRNLVKFSNYVNLRRLDLLHTCSRGWKRHHPCAFKFSVQYFKLDKDTLLMESHKCSICNTATYLLTWLDKSARYCHTAIEKSSAKL